MARVALSEAPAGQLCIAGHSMGGYVALEMMRQAPDRIEGLALLCTNARPDPPESTEVRERLMEIAKTDFGAVVKTLMPKLLMPSNVANPGMAGTITRMAMAVGVDAFMRQQRAIIARIDSRPHLAAIRCRTLVVAARHDAIMPVPWLEEMAAGIPGAKLAVIEDSGHVPSVERPAELTTLLSDWMRD